MRLPRLEIEKQNGRYRLVAMFAIVVGVWLGVLPLIGRISPVRVYIERNEALGIDPSVKFYTDLPAMPAIYDRIQNSRRQDSKAIRPRTRVF